MTEYHHVQIGRLLITSYGTLCLLTAAVMVATGFGPFFMYVMLVFGVLLAIFATLTVAVDDRAITFEYYLGFPRMRFKIEKIAACRIVRNRWYYGWGIRYTPHGWLFSVSGLQAVEIEMKNGKRYRIGTDDPVLLSRAIEQALGVAKRKRKRK
jgi:hypothetical protein